MMYDRFYPGKEWLDTDGKRIHAHGGSIIRVGEKYYWYGENKEFTDGKNGIWHYGVRMYESDDLYNWKDLGNVIPPDEKDKTSPFHPTAKMDRPHIIYNERTKKYVCWVKVMRETGAQVSTILTADQVTGPYTIVRQDLQPLSFNAGDFDLATASDSKAYYYFERVHSETICADLTDDYTDVTGYYTTHFPHHEGVPYVREATSHFMRKGKHYLITSGTTGYLPNPSEAAVGDTWHGPFTILGNPHVDDPSDTSFHSQISSVYKVPGKKDLYIALADRWLPDMIDIPYSKYETLFEIMFGEQHSIEEKQKALQEAQSFAGPQDTSQAVYVWLPIMFEDGIPKIRWYDEWRVEDFE